MQMPVRAYANDAYTCVYLRRVYMPLAVLSHSALISIVDNTNCQCMRQSAHPCPSSPPPLPSCPPTAVAITIIASPSPTQASKFQDFLLTSTKVISSVTLPRLLAYPPTHSLPHSGTQTESVFRGLLEHEVNAVSPCHGHHQPLSTSRKHTIVHTHAHHKTTLPELMFRAILFDLDTHRCRLGECNCTTFWRFYVSVLSRSNSVVIFSFGS